MLSARSYIETATRKEKKKTLRNNSLELSISISNQLCKIKLKLNGNERKQKAYILLCSGIRKRVVIKNLFNRQML